MDSTMKKVSIDALIQIASELQKHKVDTPQESSYGYAYESLLEDFRDELFDLALSEERASDSCKFYYKWLVPVDSGEIWGPFSFNQLINWKKGNLFTNENVLFTNEQKETFLPWNKIFYLL